MRKREFVAVSVLTGVAALSSVGVSAASSSATTHTLKLTSTKAAEKFLPGNHFVDADKDTSKGKFVGTDAASGSYNAKTEQVKADVVFAQSGGIIYATIAINDKTGVLTGKVSGGVGKFRGVSGTVTGRTLSEKATDLTVTYRR